MALAITIQGIDEALSHFNFRNKPALKYRLISLIRDHYEDEESLEALEGIDTDELIRVLWNIRDDLAAVRNRRKNLKSVKSAINNELKRLYEEGKNPEGIVIGSANTFVMSDEARQSAFEAFIREPKEGGAALLGQVKDVLKVLNEVLATSPYFDNGEGGEDSGKLQEIKALIRSLTDTAGVDGMGLLRSEGGDPQMQTADGARGLQGGDAVGSAVGEVMEAVTDNSVSGITRGGAEGEPSGVGDSQEAVEEIPSNEEVEELDELLEEVDEEAVEVAPEEDVGEVDGEAEEIAYDEEMEEVAELLDEVAEDEVEELLEEIEEAGGDNETGSAEGILLDIPPVGSGGAVDEREQARILAEQFNESLAAMDKFYNQYLLIPEGNYPIGSGLSAESGNMERIVHLPSFYMGKYPVTNVLFEIFIEETGYKTTAEKVGYGTVFRGRHVGKKVNEKDMVTTFSCNSALSVKVVQGACWYQPFGPGSTLYGKRGHPVVQVSLEDAMAFAAWTGKRLPTEEEWEAASRTSSGHSFPWGDEWRDNSCNIEESLIGDTTVVNKYVDFENEYKISDTLGNVLEWTVTRSKEPDQGKGLYITKGGSFISGKGICLFDRTVLQSQYHSNILGFRCVAY